ncbi:hypothetical protein BpHYR1_008030 [Brachionus plicatilis]|uniref:Uncharacterized protein n=1 Tax=Brachionus plicatilis TaxID=10195 RepID=A0A3M7T6C2_BRAPC|nr:hypothetical protein BpHYR1_008030 [Brachionus plicatilis]
MVSRLSKHGYMNETPDRKSDMLRLAMRMFWMDWRRRDFRMVMRVKKLRVRMVRQRRTPVKKKAILCDSLCEYLWHSLEFRWDKSCGESSTNKLLGSDPFTSISWSMEHSSLAIRWHSLRHTTKYCSLDW